MKEFGPQCVLTARRYIIVSPADTLVSLILDPEHKSCQPGQSLGAAAPETCLPMSVVVGGIVGRLPADDVQVDSQREDDTI